MTRTANLGFGVGVGTATIPRLLCALSVHAANAAEGGVGLPRTRSTRFRHPLNLVESPISEAINMAEPERVVKMKALLDLLDSSYSVNDAIHRYRSHEGRSRRAGRARGDGDAQRDWAEAHA